MRPPRSRVPFLFFGFVFRIWRTSNSSDANRPDRSARCTRLRMMAPPRPTHRSWGRRLTCRSAYERARVGLGGVELGGGEAEGESPPGSASMVSSETWLLALYVFVCPSSTARTCVCGVLRVVWPRALFVDRYANQSPNKRVPRGKVSHAPRASASQATQSRWFISS